MFKALKRLLFGTPSETPRAPSATTAGAGAGPNPRGGRSRAPARQRLRIPEAERPLHQAALARDVRRVLELGVGDGQRAERLIQALTDHQPEPTAGPPTLQYVAIDAFEAAGGDNPLVLREFFRRLRRWPVTVRLLPGEPLEVLRREANAIGPVDVLLLTGQAATLPLDELAFWLVRLIHPGTSLWREIRNGDTTRFEALDLAELHRLAQPRRAA